VARKAHRLAANSANQYERALIRKAELLASDPSIKRYADELPTRDYYTVHLHREDCGGGYVAYRMSWELEQKFLATYGKHDPDSMWSYEAPKGAKEVY
jgi:hypothetical protein